MPSTTGRGGAQVAQREVNSITGGYVTEPVPQSGPDAEGFAFAQRPTSIRGDYQFHPAASSGDRFGVKVGLYKGGVNGMSAAIAAIAPSATATSYTQFTATFNYVSSDVSDACVIQFQFVGPATGGLQVGPSSRPHNLSPHCYSLPFPLH